MTPMKITSSEQDLEHPHRGLLDHQEQPYDQDELR